METPVNRSAKNARSHARRVAKQEARRREAESRNTAYRKQWPDGVASHNEAKADRIEKGMTREQYREYCANMALKKPLDNYTGGYQYAAGYQD